MIACSTRRVRALDTVVPPPAKHCADECQHLGSTRHSLLRRTSLEHRLAALPRPFFGSMSVWCGLAQYDTAVRRI
eukprot:14675506-Alexandrium_andersonii.AAC.1